MADNAHDAAAGFNSVVDDRWMREKMNLAEMPKNSSISYDKVEHFTGAQSGGPGLNNDPAKTR